MATNKLIKPTNVTVQIPAFTDQPDQRVNSNCIDKSIDGINTLSDQIANYIKSYNVTMDNTGSLASGATKTVTKLISSFIDSGYTVIAVIPRYSGDDQFCFTNVSYNTTEISATVRNVSSSADSGSPSVFVIAVKT